MVPSLSLYWVPPCHACHAHHPVVTTPSHHQPLGPQVTEVRVDTTEELREVCSRPCPSWLDPPRGYLREPFPPNCGSLPHADAPTPTWR
jgi:acetone carboxylase gamma subunit